MRFDLSTKVDPEISLCLYREAYHIAYIPYVFGNSFYVLDVKRFYKFVFLTVIFNLA